MSLIWIRKVTCTLLIWIPWYFNIHYSSFLRYWIICEPHIFTSVALCFNTGLQTWLIQRKTLQIQWVNRDWSLCDRTSRWLPIQVPLNKALNHKLLTLHSLPAPCSILSVEKFVKGRCILQWNMAAHETILKVPLNSALNSKFLQGCWHCCQASALRRNDCVL